MCHRFQRVIPRNCLVWAREWAYKTNTLLERRRKVLIMNVTLEDSDLEVEYKPHVSTHRK